MASPNNPNADDIGSRLNALFKEVTDADPRPSATRRERTTARDESRTVRKVASGDRKPSSDQVVLALVRDLHAQLDDLRMQLDDAFGELVQRFDDIDDRARVELPALAAFGEHLDQVQTDLARVVATSAAQLDTARATRDALVAPVAPAAPAIDLSPVTALLDRLDELSLSFGGHRDAGDLDQLSKRMDDVAERIADQYTELRVDMERAQRVAPPPNPVDPRQLEERIRSTGIELAADIAQVNSEVTRIARSQEAQEAALNDMRASLELLKRRVL
jgi:tetrahydromethanopterin S-methyltransferase subunit G